MKKRQKTTCLTLFFLIFFSTYILKAQIIPQMAFSNAEITDILLALSAATGKSILPDETVKGTATYSFQEKMDFEKALGLFLSTYKLYYRVENNIYYVSRISVSFNSEKGLISMDAEDVELIFLIRAASKTMNITIIEESLPTGKLTIHAKDMKPDDFLSMLLAKFAGYTFEKRAGYFIIKRTGNDGVQNIPSSGLTYENGLFSINIQRVRFKELLTILFTKAGYEYQNFSQKDAILEDMRFSNKTFEEMLRLILEKASMDYQKVGNIYYLFEISQRDITKKYTTTLIIPLVNISIQDFQKLLPSEFYSSKLFKFDEGANRIILNGTLEELSPIQDFINKIDKPVANQNCYLYNLSFLEVKNLKSILPPKLKYLEPIIIPNSNSFIVMCTPQQKNELDQFIAIADTRLDSHFVRLKYLKAEDLLKSLPPSIAKENIYVTGDPSVVFFIGSKEKLNSFKKELELIDKPIPQIRYQLLVIQYNRDDSFSLETETVGSYEHPLQDEPDMDKSLGSIIGDFGGILKLNFDILGSFGAEFATKLQTKLVNSKAKVFADTTLNGISGQEIKFQNTETSRFIIPVEIESGTTTSKVNKTIEISSGLIINIKGWISGDGMITMDLNATISKKKGGSEANQLPSTSEKIINTHVRTRSGEPIIISGLIYQDFDQSIQKVPILADIPLLGLLFQRPAETIKNIEMVIYIIPQVQLDDLDNNHTQTLERYYNTFIKNLKEITQITN